MRMRELSHAAARRAGFDQPGQAGGAEGGGIRVSHA
jgi:hypothetical protein